MTDGRQSATDSGFGAPARASDGPQPARDGWGWVTFGAIGIAFGIVLAGELGSSLADVRTILAPWLLIAAAFAAWRSWIDLDRSPLLLISALIGLSVGAIVLFGGVVAWAHGTTGLGFTCAPSRDSDPLSHIPWVNDMLDQGWVVAASDYAGAGGTGIGEKYLVIAEQARDVLNSMRAARALPGTGAGDRFASYGESQGGLISFAAGALAPSYAPELKLIGVGGVAAASDAGAAIQLSWPRPLAGWLLGPSLVRAWTRQYPNLDADAVLSAAAREHYQEVADESCIFDILGALVNPQMGSFFATDPTTDTLWRAAFIANRAPLPPPGVPVFVSHGLADPLIDPGYSARLVQRYCDAGAVVATHWMPGEGHIGSSTAAAPAFITWLGNLLSGASPPSNCGETPPVPPAPDMK